MISTWKLLLLKICPEYVLRLAKTVKIVLKDILQLNNISIDVAQIQNLSRI